MRKLSTAIALIVATTASSAFAFDATDMRMGRTMLETQISIAFKEFGIKQDLTVLSLAQIAQIEAILSDPDKSSGGNNVKSAVEAVIRNN